MCARSRRSLVSLLLATSALLFVNGPPALCQLSDWSAISVSGPTIKLEHSMAYELEGATVRAFSGLTRKWSSFTASSGGPVLSLMNEHLIVQDGQDFYGFSTRSSAFVPLGPVSGAATLLPPTSGQNWQSVVLDGNDLHLFSAYSGQWTHTHFSAPPAVTIKNLTVLIDDGTTIYGMSPLFGNAVPLAATGASVLGVFGGVGLASAPGVIYGFSSHQNTWTSMPVSGTPSVTNGFSSQPAFVTIQDGSSISFFSGQSGTFTTVPAAPSAFVFQHRACAIVIDGNTVYGYSGLTGEYKKLSLASAPTATLSHFFGLVSTATATYGYSAETNTFSAPLNGSFNFTLGQTAAFAAPSTGTAPGAAYSSLTNQWTAAPVGNVGYVVAANAVILVTPGGLFGIAPRSTTWEYQPTSPTLTATYQANTPQGPGIFVAADGTNLLTFSSLSGHWRTIVADHNILTFKGHWGSAILEDGSNAYAYGEFNDRWSVIPLSAGSNGLGAQVESAYVLSGNDLIAYTAFGQLMTTADYPEYFRGIAIGGSFQLDLVGEPNKAALLFLGLPAEIPTQYGILGVDPNTFTIFATLSTGPLGHTALTLPVPNDPILKGISVNFQAAIAGIYVPYLTNAINERIL